MSSTSTPLEHSEEMRAFLQRRVAWAGLIAGGLGAFFLLYRAVTSATTGQLEAEVSSPSFLYHAGAVAPFVAMWLVCWSGRRSVRLVRTVETIGLVGGSIGYSAMGACLPLVVRPDYIVLLALSYGLMARAAYVPSSARRTALLSVAVAIPSLVVAFLSFAEMDLEKWAPLFPVETMPSATSVAASSTLFLAAWWVCAGVTCVLTSRVIYGLRKEVRDVRKLGQYTLHKKLGEGGMGAVYSASHAMLKRPTAIKLLPLEKAGATSLARFEREVQLTAQLTHPNTVTIHDYGRTPEGIFYYAMELLDGATLADLVELSGAMPPARVARILDQVAGALAEAHGIGLIHRDIKPANIMIVDQGGAPDVAKVLDFGLVKDLKRGEDTESLTHAETITGTPQYLSPEAIKAPESVDARSDLYALGAVAYFMLTGVHVFPGKSVLEVCGDHLHTPPIPPSQRVGITIPAELEQIVLDCLAKDPAERPQSALDLKKRVRDSKIADDWSDNDAQTWWEDHRDAVTRFVERRTESASGGTLEIDLLGRADTRLASDGR